MSRNQLFLESGKWLGRCPSSGKPSGGAGRQLGRRIPAGQRSVLGALHKNCIWGMNASLPHVEDRGEGHENPMSGFSHPRFPSPLCSTKVAGFKACMFSPSGPRLFLQTAPRARRRPARRPILPIPLPSPLTNFDLVQTPKRRSAEKPLQSGSLQGANPASSNPFVSSLWGII